MFTTMGDMSGMRKLFTEVAFTKMNSFDIELADTLLNLGYSCNIMVPLKKVNVCLLIVQTVFDNMTRQEFTSFSVIFLDYPNYIKMLARVVGPDFNTTDNQFNRVDFEIEAWTKINKFKLKNRDD